MKQPTGQIDPFLEVWGIPGKYVFRGILALVLWGAVFGFLIARQTMLNEDCAEQIIHRPVEGK
jgi:hypothetical protein